MTWCDLRTNLSKVSVKYTVNRHARAKFYHLVRELDSQWFEPRYLKYPISLDLEKIPSKIKFCRQYSRKDIVRIFSELGLKVTRYTNEYGKTIVHFEPISDSE